MKTQPDTDGLTWSLLRRRFGDDVKRPEELMFDLAYTHAFRVLHKRRGSSPEVQAVYKQRETELKTQIKQEWSFIRAWTAAAVRLFSKCTRCQNCKYDSTAKRFACALMNPLSLAQHTDPRALRTMTCEKFTKRPVKKSADAHLVKG